MKKSLNLFLVVLFAIFVAYPSWADETSSIENSDEQIVVEQDGDRESVDTLLLIEEELLIDTADGDKIAEQDVAVAEGVDIEVSGGDLEGGVKKPLVYVFPVREDIMPSAMRLTNKCLEEAREMGADYVIIDMDTYGGLVDAADSMRTQILNYDIPIYLFVNNQAASAGALIAIAADKIYMRGGASMGAATVVDHTGEPAPPKFQSFMMGMMRATAEAHGKVVDRVDERSDTVWRWFRDPQIAAAMVDPSVVIPDLVEEGQVLTFSTEEAIKWHYCEGRASSVDEIMRLNNIEDYDLVRYERTTMDRVVGFLTSPGFQGIMIMLIVGGIYFEIQTPGVGFPLIVAVAAALLYFSPLYIEGLLANWELIVFIIGIILLLVEIFVTPGFGVLGILGIVAMVVGLTFAMIDTDLLKYIPQGQVSFGIIIKPLLLVIISVTASLILSISIGRRVLVGESKLQGKVVLRLDMVPEEGFISHLIKSDMVGEEGLTYTELRPAGRVLVDGELHPATSSDGQFIERNIPIVVVRDEGGILYCREKE